MENSFVKDCLRVRIFPTLEQMARSAAEDVAEELKRFLSEQQEVNVIFAAAPSQKAFLSCLVADPGIDWTRVNAFHMDEYIGLAPGDPRRFSSFLDGAVFRRVDFKSVNYIDPDPSDPGEECVRYAALLKEYPVDIVCLGIGENGHIAFNDPWVADFNDPLAVKVVDLDPVCRMQQVNEKCFDSLDEVPRQAVTVTVPALLKARRMFCVVPFPGKAKAVKAAVQGPVTEDCPASVLRTREGAVLYLDGDSSALLDGKM